MIRDTLIRVTLGLTLWPVLFAMIAWAPLWSLHLLIVAAAAMAAFETTHLLLRDGTTPLRWIASAVTGAMTLTMGFMSVAAFLGITGCLGVVSAAADRLWLRNGGALSIVMCYVAVPLALLALLSKGEAGRFWMSFVLASTWSRDVGAFLVGRVTRGRPIAPELSPRKTWAGAWGGVAGAIVCCLAFSMASRLDAGSALILALTIGVLGQAGDLFESALKRSASSRHSSELLGAQGGVIDLIDGHLFTIPFVTLYVSLQTGGWR